MKSIFVRLGCAMIVVASFALSSALADPPSKGEHRAAKPELTKPTPPPSIISGPTFHDEAFHVTWLTDANLAATANFEVPNISPDGSMDYPTALAWVEALRKNHYLGHNNWTLPTSPAVDRGCNAKNVNNFGYNCTLSAMGSLYYNVLGLTWPQAVVTNTGGPIGPFRNFQPNIYWTDEHGKKNKNGYGTFSFNTGAQMSNVDQNYFYVLPMIPGRLPGTPIVKGALLQPSADGKTVYDPVANVTWTSDANLAAREKFKIPVVNAANGVANFSPTGGMTHTAAVAWIYAMNGASYAGQSKWQLPPLPAGQGNWTQCSNASPVAGCSGNPLGELFYNQLHGQKGKPVTPIPNAKVGVFQNFQPYLYWSCNGDAGQTVCSTAKPLPAPNYGWSFNFGDGFQGTDQQTNYLHVWAYYPDPTPLPPRAAAPKCAPGRKCPKPL